MVRDEWEQQQQQQQNLNGGSGGWRPQFDQCPICAMKFDIIGDFEEFEEDVAYFILKNKLGQTLNRRLHEKERTHYLGQGKKTNEKLISICQYINTL